MNERSVTVVKEAEMATLLQVLFEQYGYDFTNYAKASLLRRINRVLIVDRIPSFAELLFKVRSQPMYLTHLVQELTVNVTEMFRDPLAFKTLRQAVLPILATHPVIRIWHAGCASGEEVYAMAILLHEAGLLHKARLYATDLNASVIETVRQGIFPLSAMKHYSENYIAAGGMRDFSTYYTAKYGYAKFNDALRQNMVVATHNLVSDQSFNEFQLIFCRNVLIYFNKTLQDSVLRLFDNSLEPLGFLVLGARENLRFTSIASSYTQLENGEKIWRKTTPVLT